MSIESARKFVEKLQEEDNFAKGFFACTDSDERKKFIKDKGFEFTREEVDKVKEEISVSGGNFYEFKGDGTHFGCW